jgi:hypothetical protein
MSRYRWSALLALPTLLSASPVPTIDSPCSKIQSYLQPVPNGSTAKGQVSADLAWNCLQSIPLNASAALDLVESIKPYVSFQSTLAFLKNPPAEYAEKIQEPHDVFGALDQVSDKIKSGAYSGEYEVSILRDCQDLVLTGRSSDLSYIELFRLLTMAICTMSQMLLENSFLSADLSQSSRPQQMERISQQYFPTMTSSSLLKTERSSLQQSTLLTTKT